MYAERNSRLLNQGPASDRIHRLSPGFQTTEVRSHVQKGRSVVTGSRTVTDSVTVPTSHGITLSRHDVLEASYTRRASPLLAGLSAGITSSSGNSITRQGISLP